jgi:hypothetical protein
VKKAPKTEEKPIGMVMLPGCRCRCGHEWLSRSDEPGERPHVCPKCKSPRWDKEKLFERK